MATRDESGFSAATAIEISDSESDSLYMERHGLGPHGAICRWRTDRYFDQECSRYFDCPSHTIERAVVEHDVDHETDDEVMEDADGGDIGVAVSRVSDGPAGHRSSPDPRPSPSSASTPPRHTQPGPSAVIQVLGSSPASEGQQRAMPGTSVNPIVIWDSPGAMRSPRLQRPQLHPDPGPIGVPGNEVQEVVNLPSIGSVIREIESSSSSRVTQSSHFLRWPLNNSNNNSNNNNNNNNNNDNNNNPPSVPALPGSLVSPSPNTVQSPGSEIVLPRWQPDAEVTYCPICHTQFSIFVRKHHCRKCGRVVCNQCSPHRITIPYQYIVQPPGTPRVLAQRYPSSLISGEGGYADFSSLGGGERVRLCNPCVPDPNITPPQAQDASSQRGHSRSQSTVTQSHSSTSATRAAPSTWTSYFGALPSDHVRTRSTTVGSNQPSFPGSRHQSSQYQSLSTQNRILAGTPPAYFPSSSSGTPYRYLPYSGMPSRHRSMVDVGGAGPSNTPPAAAASSSSSSAAAAAPGSTAAVTEAAAAASRLAANRRLRHLPPTTQTQTPQPYQIPEEDECPVCHRELPSRSLHNFDTLRESHINTCVTAHSTYSGTPTGGSAAGTPGSPTPPIEPRRTGMFPYLATEKDCVDSAECTICLEEFEVGVPMARLECLCRFHRTCISAWWERHPGRCPMHQHDSFGY